MATLSLFSACRDAGAWSVLEILGVSGDFLLFSARRDAGAWSVLEILGVSGDPLGVFPRVVTLARGASAKFWA